MAKVLSARDAKLIQYLNEAYGKEKQLETVLEAHVRMTPRAPYKKRLQQHLRETKDQAKALQRRIRELGGKAEAVSLPGPELASETAGRVAAGAAKAIAAAQGSVDAVRGTGDAEKMLKNAKAELADEHEEIANYLAIETLGDALGDRDTVKLARQHRRQEERMASFLTKLVPQLTKAMVTEAFPRSERSATSAARTRRTPARATATRSRAAASASGARTSSPRARPASRARSRRRERAS